MTRPHEPRQAARTPEAAERKKRVSEAKPSGAQNAADDAAAIWETLFDDLSSKRARRCGNRHKPEPPTLVAELRPEHHKGKIWLSGMPREGDLEAHF